MTTITEPALEAGSDEGLMQHIQADDVGAFAELYDRHSGRAFGVARAICGSSHLAENAVQEGFVAVWRSRGSFDPIRGSARAWLFTVVRHRSLDLMRRTRRDDDRRHSGDALDSLLALGSVEADAAQRDDAARVCSSLLKLPS
jgi:RNA polymerase sigma factor (sigma-70 family)